MIDHDPEILNAALDLATEWGDNFPKPIAERMKSRFPGIANVEIDQAEAIAKKAESRIYQLAEMEERGEISESDITRFAIEEFPWVDDSQIGRLKNIGMYYARR